MKKFASILFFATTMAAVSLPAAALADGHAAEASVNAKRGSMLYGSDGKRIGQVYRVNSDGSVGLIYRGKMIAISANTLSNEDGKLTTSLTNDEVRAIR